MQFAEVVTFFFTRIPTNLDEEYQWTSWSVEECGRLVAHLRPTGSASLGRNRVNTGFDSLRREEALQ
jgi:hypothetical protein